MARVFMYDTTLRDGTQGEAFQLSVAEKIRVAHLLDDLGIAYIEGGWPGSNPRDEAFFEAARKETFANTRITAFGSTRRFKLSCDDDPSIQALLAAEVPVLTIFGKSWIFQATEVLGITPDQNLELIHDSVRYLKERADEVIFDAEHFFDGAAQDESYAMSALQAAADAGADFLVLCDTNGGSLPSDVGALVSKATARFDVPVGVHTHNDGELAVANSLAAVQGGATMVQGTINGYGERCGNANLASILPALQLKMGFEVVGAQQLAALTPTAHYLDEICNVSSDPDRAYVGRNAFAHKAGMHAAGIAADARTFEHLDPALVGNARDILPSELSGKATIRGRASDLGLELDDAAAGRSVERLKEREHRGYHYEAAPASFELLLRRESGEYQPLFALESFRVVVEKHSDGEVTTEATVKVSVDGERYFRAAEGNGPVNALDRALREAIADRYPHLAEIELTNYKVRILDEAHGTGAVTRVLLDSADSEREWGTIGVSENIIEASWEALVDSLEYAFQPRPRQ